MSKAIFYLRKRDCLTGLQEHVQYLIQHRADPSVKNSMGDPIFLTAVLSGQTDAGLLLTCWFLLGSIRTSYTGIIWGFYSHVPYQGPVS